MGRTAGTASCTRGFYSPGDARHCGRGCELPRVPSAYSCCRRRAAPGKRCQQLLAAVPAFELALRMRREGAPLGEVFSFLSALYFRGKLTYAQRFATPPDGCPGVLVITPDRGLVAPETAITTRRPARVRAGADRRGRAPLCGAAARRRARAARRGCRAAREVVLLGSIATPKYVDVLLPVFGRRAALPGRFRRPRRHEPRRAAAARRARRARARLSARRRRHAPRPARGEDCGSDATPQMKETRWL